MADQRHTLVQRLFAEHRASLESFFRRRTKVRADAADLAQEVYLRMLRVSDADAIRCPERYLYTVAINLARERAILDRRRAASVDIDDPTVQQQLADLPPFDAEVDSARRAARLREVLAELGPRCRATVMLHYRQGLSYDEIAERLGVTPHMVKKYIVQALAHCRRRMARLG